MIQLIKGFVIVSYSFLMFIAVWHFSTPAPVYFQVGDCVQHIDPDAERWEQSEVIRRVEEVGKKAYRVSFYSGGVFYPSVFIIKKSDKDYYKVECPKESKQK